MKYIYQNLVIIHFYKMSTSQKYDKNTHLNVFTLRTQNIKHITQEKRYNIINILKENAKASFCLLISIT